MQINLTGHHVDLTDPLRSYVNDKFEKLERHFDHLTSIHVVLGVEKLRHKAEATIHMNGNSVFAVVRENGKWYVGRFNKELELQARSEDEVLAYTPLQLNDGILYVQLDNGKVAALIPDTLGINE